LNLPVFHRYISLLPTVEEDGEEPEKEMGDANAEDIVDEKQWDDKEDKDDDGGEDGRDKEEEKFEKDSKMQGEAIEGEMRTKEDEDDGNDKVSLVSISVVRCFSSSPFCTSLLAAGQARPGQGRCEGARAE
jgi:hypothetical protein